MEHSMWAHWPERVSSEEFRREGDYLAQLGGDGGMTIEHYRATFDYLRQREPGYLALFQEDDAFGVKTFEFDGKVVSRDLMDSVLEIGFLRDRLRLAKDADITVLDIGAGYGRFAHRFEDAFPLARVYCTDAIKKSSEICSAYLSFRHCSALVISPDRIPMVPSADLAVNIHSWSECTISSIALWLELLKSQNVKHLFLVPHNDLCLSMEADGSAFCFLPLIIHSGFKLVQAAPKYPKGVNGVYPTQYFLFTREAN
jgi:putative sugar O-methyltransferase